MQITNEELKKLSPKMRSYIILKRQCFHFLTETLGGTVQIVFQERYLDLRKDTPCRHSVTNIYEAQYKGHKAQSVEPEAAACYLFVNMGWIEDPWR